MTETVDRFCEQTDNSSSGWAGKAADAALPIYRRNDFLPRSEEQPTFGSDMAGVRAAADELARQRRVRPWASADRVQGRGWNTIHADAIVRRRSTPAESSGTLMALSVEFRSVFRTSIKNSREIAGF
jgi:hypothetical protein